MQDLCWVRLNGDKNVWRLWFLLWPVCIRISAISILLQFSFSQLLYWLCCMLFNMLLHSLCDCLHNLCNFIQFSYTFIQLLLLLKGNIKHCLKMSLTVSFSGRMMWINTSCIYLTDLHCWPQTDTETAAISASFSFPHLQLTIYITLSHPCSTTFFLVLAKQQCISFIKEAI